MDNDTRAVEIRGARRAKGWLQSDLAKAAGVSERTVRNIEAGRSVAPATERLVYHALGMDRSPTWPPDVETFLQMVGYRLTSADEDERKVLITRITHMLVGS